jgi:cobalt-zinc-cadmium efflux system protein
LKTHTRPDVTGSRRAAPADPHRPFATALGITLVLLAVEAVGGWLTGSLALLADAGHLLADAGALGIGFIGSWIASRPATAEMSYGYRRAEILAAVTNGFALWVVAGAILYEAVQRLHLLHPVSAPGMLVVALIGLAGNVASSAVLARGHGGNLNLRVALTHTLADAAAAVGTIAASFVILTTGWVQADAIVSIGIAALILAGSWPLLREAVRILMEGAPPHLSLTEVEAAMRGVPGVTGVHDLHIWSLTAGLEAVSGHVLVADPAEGQRVLRDLCGMLSERYGLGHATLQLETEASSDPWHPNCAPGSPAGSDR